MKIYYLLHFFWSLGAIAYGTFAFASHDYNFLLFCAILLWVNNIQYALRHFKERSYFFFFNLTFFIFLLGRPIISLLQGWDWVKYVHTYSSEADVWLGLKLMVLSLASIGLGGIGGNLLCKKLRKDTHLKSASNSFFLYNLKWISMCIFGVALISTICGSAEKMIFVLGHSYVEYYSSFQSKLPYIVYVFSTFLQPSLCLYLITYPPKKKVYPILVIYVISTIPDLISGERNPFVLSVLFSLIYFIYRDYIGDRKKWIGSFEKTALIAGIPVGVCVLGLLNYVREGTSVSFNNVFDIIVDFFFKQGVTFAWYCSGLGILYKLPQPANYTFGSIADYFKYGSLAQIFFGAEALQEGNNLQRALNGNSMAHHLSYALLGQEYLNGHGCGSSYLLELYADYQEAGVFIFSVLLGAFLIVSFFLAKRNSIFGAIMLLTINGILFMPRAEVMGGLGFILRIPFWCTFLVCVIGGLLFYRRYRQ